MRGGGGGEKKGEGGRHAQQAFVLLACRLNLFHAWLFITFSVSCLIIPSVLGHARKRRSRRNQSAIASAVETFWNEPFFVSGGPQKVHWQETIHDTLSSSVRGVQCAPCIPAAVRSTAFPQRANTLREKHASRQHASRRVNTRTHIGNFIRN